MPTNRSLSPFPHRLLIALSLVLLLLVPGGQLGAATPSDSPNAPPFFTGTVYYDSDMGPPRPEGDVSLNLYGVPLGGGDPVLVDTFVTGASGFFELIADSNDYESFAIVKEEPRGLVPGWASAGSLGTVADASMVVYPGSVQDMIPGNDFGLLDPYPFFPLLRDRYLIVTTAAVVPALDDFIAYKEYLGFDMEVVTVEELDPGGVGGNVLRTAIRDYERGLDQEPAGLKYVLLIGTDDTVPFLKIEASRDDWVRKPYDEWPDHCKDAGLPHEENTCGLSTAWYYVDLYSDWDSNNDGILGEAFWAEGYTRDNPPAFNVDVFAGRLPFDNPATVEDVLDTIMAFEQDGGPWKQNALLAGAMYDLGGLKWVPTDAMTGTYEIASGPTDAGYIMEGVWNTFLYAEGFSRVRLYEKDHPPTGYSPSIFSVDAPLSRAEMINQWQAQDYGLVKAAGHGGAGGIGRRTWANDYPTYGQVEHPTIPFPPDDLSLYERGRPGFLFRDDVNHMVTPSGKAPVLMVMACSTGAWYNPNNLPAAYLAAGRISAWIGGTSSVPYRFEWKILTDGYGQSVDYIITDAIFRRHLPLGDAVWTGLDDHHTMFGPGWGNGTVDGAFFSWDLYGDPSMDYWGNGPDLRASWPMFHYDWPGRGQTALSGPGPFMQVYWTQNIAATPNLSRTPSPVIGQQGRLVIGDHTGVVHAFDHAGNSLWSYPTGSPIDSAAALGLDGTAYVQTTGGTLYAIKEDGTLRWSKTVGQSDASPKIAGTGTIYVAGSDNNGPGGSTRYLVMAYRSSGARIGLAEVDARVTTAPSIAPDGTVWVGTAAGTLYELPRNLSSATAHSLSPGAAIGDGLALADDADETVLVPTANGEVIAWSALNDTVRWTFTAGATVRSAPAVGQNGKVFFGSQDGKVYALQLSDGSKLWEVDTGGPVDSSPALDPVNVYVIGGNPTQLYVLRGSDGAFLPAAIPLGGTSLGGSSPAIGGSKMIFLVSSNGLVMAIGRYQMPPPPELQTEEWPWEIYVEINPGDPLAWHVLERRTLGGVWSPIVSISPGGTQFIDRGVSPGVVYQYRGYAMYTMESLAAEGTPSARQAGDSEYSPIVQARALRAVPDAPATPVVTPLSSSELRLSWTAPLTAPISMRILRRDPDQPGFNEVALIPGAVTEFVDSELISDTLYGYRLQAVDEAGESDRSGAGWGTTWAHTLPAPRRVVVTPLDKSTVRVCWLPGAYDLASVVARLPDGEEEFDRLAQVIPGQTCFTDHYAYPYTFEYWVKHVAPGNESDWAQSGPIEVYEWRYMHRAFLPVVSKP